MDGGYPAARRAPLKRFASLLLALALGGCAAGPETAPLRLDPEPDARVWPLPPETPRYAYVRTLIGERDFVTPGRETADAMVSALKWLAGLVIGEPEYVELERPVSGMTDERGWIYVIDASHKAVLVFDMVGQRLLNWKLAAPGLEFKSPVAITGDGRGGYLVTDSELGEVFRLDAEGEPAGRFGKGILKRPTGIARDAATDQVYVADTASHDIKIFDGDGVLVDILGGHGPIPGTFNFPTYMVFSHDRLYVSDTLNFRVQVFDRAGDGRLAFGRLGLFVGNMTRPKGVAVGRDGRIYVVESYFDYLLIYNGQGELLLPIGGTGQEIGKFYLPSGVWTDDFGRVYIADMFNGRVVVFKELTSEQAL